MKVGETALLYCGVLDPRQVTIRHVQCIGDHPVWAGIEYSQPMEHDSKFDVLISNLYRPDQKADLIARLKEDAECLQSTIAKLEKELSC